MFIFSTPISSLEGPKHEIFSVKVFTQFGRRPINWKIFFIVFFIIGPENCSCVLLWYAVHTLAFSYHMGQQIVTTCTEYASKALKKFRRIHCAPYGVNICQSMAANTSSFQHMHHVKLANWYRRCGLCKISFCSCAMYIEKLLPYAQAISCCKCHLRFKKIEQNVTACRNLLV